MSGGTIPDRGYFGLRTADTKALIGELDEEFVWERSLGDTFVFGAQGWRIQKIDHQNVEVVPVAARIGMSPFWKAEERNRDFRPSERIPARWRNGTPASRSRGSPRGAAKASTGWSGRPPLRWRRSWPGSGRQRRRPAPSPSPAGGAHAGPGTAGRTSRRMHRPSHPVGRQGQQALRPRAVGCVGGALRLPPRDATRPTMRSCFSLPEEGSAEELLSLVDPGSIERLLRRRLEGSGFFGARFREGAGRALLLPRASARGRTPAVAHAAAGEVAVPPPASAPPSPRHSLSYILPLRRTGKCLQT